MHVGRLVIAGYSRELDWRSWRCIAVGHTHRKSIHFWP